jgi:N-acetylneuraminic acid mutarotase
MATPVNFANREKAAYTAMGSKVFIWGGQNAAGQALADGAIYDPETNTWTPVGSAGAPPSARVLATAVWTGSVVVVWGGGDVGNDNDYGTGSRYDPLTNSWTAITNFNAPSGRRAPYGFWTGSRVIYYAGFDHNGGAFSAPYLYDPVNNSWSNTDGPSRPPAYLNPTVSWTGTQLVVYGGLASNNFPSAETYVYDLAGDVWSHEADGPNARSGALGAWDGALLLAWSGINGNTLRIDGKVYDLATDKWTNVGAMNAPAARWAPHRQTGWSFRVKPRVTLMVGGYGSTSFRTDGGIYNSTTNAWSAVAAWPSNYSHLWGVSVWTGTELILWGGRQGTGATLTNAGERYFP